jgi:phosphate-selective porin OprO/OprP
MKRFAAVLVALLVSNVHGVALAADSDTTLRTYWKDGLRMETADKQFKFKMGGRIMVDWAWFDVDQSIETATEEHKSSTEFRRARLYLAGEIYESVIFKAQYDFAGGDADFSDVYVGLKGLGPLGTVRIGHVFEPIGLEQNTSSKYITFMERSLTGVFTPGRNTGILFNNNCVDGRMTWALGAFRDTDSFGDSGDDNMNLSARLTGTPVATDDALVHLGVSYRYGVPDDTMLELDSRPSVHMAEDWVDTGDLDIDTNHTVGGELAAIMGPGSFQVEYFHQTNESDSGASVDDPEFTGYYVMGSVFVTGESRNYDSKKASFKRVKPHENFTTDGGTGAIELALRFSSLDLTDGGATGGELWDVTAAINWYLNPNTRVMLNYVHADVEDGVVADGEGDMFQTRFQIDF